MIRTRGGCAIGPANDIHVERGPANVARTELTMVDRHILGAYCLGIDTIKERNRPSSKNTRRNIAGFGRLLRRLGDDGHGCRVKGCPDASVGSFCAILIEGWWGRLSNVERKLETLRLGSAGDVKELEAGGHVVIEGCLLLKVALASFRHDGHRELLGAKMPNWAFNMDDGGWAEEALLAAIRLLGNGGVKADDGGHGHDSRRVVRDMVADNAANLRVWVVCICFVKLALADRGLGG